MEANYTSVLKIQSSYGFFFNTISFEIAQMQTYRKNRDTGDGKMQRYYLVHQE